jgi:hypothetical protein
VSHDFWVSFFFIHGIFFITRVLMHILFCNYVFGCLKQATTRITHLWYLITMNHKVVKDAISYAQIQANNQYYKEILGQKMNKEMGSSSIYLTEEQCRQVKNPKCFDLQRLRLILI